MESQLQEQRNKRSDIMQHFTSEFVEKYKQDPVFMAVAEQLTKSISPYQIIQELIEKSALDRKESSSFQMDLEKYSELERKYKFGNGYEE
jgi:hypothetical protein